MNLKMNNFFCPIYTKVMFYMLERTVHFGLKLF